ncbi:hypothetical protein [Agrococcus casei]|uniref:hypothetical protein n=1 Tax=Agrococcus casei TaxID=343512 RepID=UPI003F928EEA
MLASASKWRRTAQVALAGALAVGLAAPLTGMASTGAAALTPTPALDVPTDQTSLVLNYFNDFTLNNVRDADDPIPTSTRVYVQDAEGTLWNTAAGSNELVVFPDMAPGEAKILYSGGAVSGKVATDANGNRLEVEAGPGQVETHKIDEETGEVVVSNLNLTGNYFTASVTLGEGQVTEHQAAVSTTKSQATVSIVDAEGTVIDADPSIDFSFTNGAAELAAERWANNSPGRYNAVDASGSASGISAPALTVHAPEGYAIHSATASAGNAQLPVAIDGTTATVQATDLPRRTSTIAWTIAFTEQTEPVASTELNVRYWADRVVDGVYDTSVTDESGRTDELPATSGIVYVIDADGEYWSTTAGEDGLLSFPGIAAGEAKVLMGVSNEQMTVQDAASDRNLPATREHYTQPVTYIDPETGEHRESRVGGQLLFEGTAVVAEETVEGETADFRTSLVRTSAEITLDGEAVGNDYASVEFANNDEWFATGFGGNGTYIYPLHGTDDSRAQSLGAHTVSVKVEAAEGYRVDSVTPANGGDEMTVTEANGVYTVQTTELTTSFDIIKWNIVVSEEPAGAEATVQFWNDRVVDGVFDTSVADDSGRTDASNTGYAYLQDADGKWWSTTADDNGEFGFAGIAEGEARVFFTLSNDRGTVQNADDQHLARTTEPRGTTGVTYIDSSTGDRIENTSIPQSGTFFEGTVVAGASADAFEFRSAMVMTNATITVDGEAAAENVAEVSFFNNDDTFAAVRTSGGLLYPKQPASERDQQAFGAHDFGLSVAVAEGYEVVSITASDRDDAVAFTEADGTYTVSTTDLGSNFDVVRWNIEIAPVPPVTELTVQYWNDRVVDGVFGEGDRLNDSGYVYLQDADGEWFSTSADEQGQFTFTGAAEGEAKVFFTLANTRGTVQNADDQHLTRTTEHGGQPVTYVDPATGETTDARIPSSTPLLQGTATVSEAGVETDVEQFRSTMIHTNATVSADGETASAEAAQLVFANNGDVFETASNASGTQYPVHPGSSSQQAFGAHAFSLTVTPAAGYEIASVTATSSGESVDVAASGSTYNVQTEPLGSSFAVVTWSVELVEIQTEASVEFWSDRVVDGVYDTSVRDVYGYTDAHNSGYVYLRDADGSWFSTTLNADGLHTFTGVAAGPADVFFTVPGGGATVQGADDQHLPTTREHRGQTDVTYIDPVTGEQTPGGVIPAIDLYAGAITVAEAGESSAAAEFRSSTVEVIAEITGKGRGKASVAFFNNDEVFAAERGKGQVFTPVSDSGDAVFGAHTVGIAVQVKKGHEVSSVTAVNAGVGVEVTDLGNGVYAVQTADLNSSFDSVEFEVEIDKQRSGGFFGWIGGLFETVTGWLGDSFGDLGDWLGQFFGRR